MKTITLLTVAAILLQNMFGTKSSVGGPMTIAFILLLAMLAVGLHEAWANRRGVGGWILNIAGALAGGFIVAFLVSMALDELLPHLQLEGSLVATQHPLLYVLSTAMAVLTVLGSWAATRFINRGFSKSAEHSPVT